MADLITLHIFAEDYPRIKSWQLAGWCKSHGADEFTVAAITTEGTETGLLARFDETMAPFQIPVAPRRHLTASRNHQFIREAELWKLTSASFAALQEFFQGGIFSYHNDPDNWFEDLMLYRHGELMLGVVSHESEGILRVTAAERQELEAEGFPFRSGGEYVGY